MNLKKVRLIFITSGLFLLVDQFLKWQVTHAWRMSRLVLPRVGWELFFNTGAAFGLPLGNKPIIFFTLIIIGLVVYLLIKELKKEASDSILLLAWSLILCGAISNLLDRTLHAYVIDYFLLGTAIINVADAMIVCGLSIYMIKLFKTKKV
jgi:signal peptidase II